MGCFKLFSSPLLKPTSLIFCTHLLSAPERSHSPLKSHFHLRVPRKNMCRRPHLFDPNTLGSVCPDCRRTGAYRPHTPLLLLLMLLLPETEEHAQCSSKSCSRQRHSVSHTCCICVHRSCSPTGKLHQSDNLLQPAVKAALITRQLSVSSPGSGSPHAARRSRHSTSVTLAAATVRAAICAGAAVSRSRSQSRTHLICFRGRRRRCRCLPSATNQSCSSECYTA